MSLESDPEILLGLSKYFEVHWATLRILVLVRFQGLTFLILGVATSCPPLKWQNSTTIKWLNTNKSLYTKKSLMASVMKKKLVYKRGQK